MVKGFIHFQDGRIPFVIENYRMELFTDDPLLSDFIKEYNRKSQYILKGQCFGPGSGQSQDITVLIEYSVGNTCYLMCYLVEKIVSGGSFDSIGFQSPFLDDIFRFRYEYLDLVRKGVNLVAVTRDIYQIPFQTEDNSYELVYRIGHDESLGLLDNLEKNGEAIIHLVSADISECYILSTVLQRFASFMVSRTDPSFRNIILYSNGHAAGRFYCKYVSGNGIPGYDILFCEFDVLKYVPAILKNIALDSGNKITQSVPLGHLAHAAFSYTPQRFIEQMTAFEYLFEKLEPAKAKNKGFPLRCELKYMFDSFSEILSTSKYSSDVVSEELKEVRRNIVHGYAYYYDFDNDYRMQYMVMRFEELIKAMSLKLMGFTHNDIVEYMARL